VPSIGRHGETDGDQDREKSGNLKEIAKPGSLNDRHFGVAADRGA
jgi:hypothetical protein